MIAQVDGASIAYDDVGSGPPIVFLHAFPLDSGMWAPQRGALIANWRCLFIDQRGIGESTASPPYSMDRFADDAAAVLDRATVSDAVVVGLSMGGYVALALWRRHRDRVRALVLADTRAGADTEEGRQRRLELADLARREGIAAVAERQISGLLGKTTREKRAEVMSTARGMMATASVDGIVGALDAMRTRPDSAATLSTIDVPTLVMVGDEDVITPIKEARALHEGIAGSRLEVLSGAGHLSNLERPAAFNAVLGEFLRAVNAY